MSDVTIEQRRRWLVGRQLLGGTNRSERSIEDVSAALGLLHSTDPVTPYLSLHARSDATVDDIDEALYERRSLIRFTTIRRTVFVMDAHAASGAYGCFNMAVARKLRAQLVAWLATSDDVDGAADAYLAETESAVIESLRLDGPATGAQLSERVPALRAVFDPMPGASYSKPIRATSKVLEVLGAELRITRGRPTGADYTSGAWRWEACDDLRSGRVAALDPDAALAQLIGRYLGSFAPATVTDMTWWTGLTKTKIRGALDRLDAIEVHMEGAAEPGYVLAAFDGETEASSGPSVALLPGLDSTTMGWKQRSWYVDDAAATGIFDRNGNAGPTVWVDGRVVGAWTQRADGEIAIEWCEQVDGEVTRLADAEADRMRQWLDEIRIRWRYPTAATKRLSS